MAGSALIRFLATLGLGSSFAWLAATFSPLHLLLSAGISLVYLIIAVFSLRSLLHSGWKFSQWKTLPVIADGAKLALLSARGLLQLQLLLSLLGLACGIMSSLHQAQKMPSPENGVLSLFRSAWFATQKATERLSMGHYLPLRATFNKPSFLQEGSPLLSLRTPETACISYKTPLFAVLSTALNWGMEAWPSDSSLDLSAWKKAPFQGKSAKLQLLTLNVQNDSCTFASIAWVESEVPGPTQIQVWTLRNELLESNQPSLLPEGKLLFASKGGEAIFFHLARGENRETVIYNWDGKNLVKNPQKTSLPFSWSEQSLVSPQGLVLTPLTANTATLCLWVNNVGWSCGITTPGMLPENWKTMSPVRAGKFAALWNTTLASFTVVDWVRTLATEPSLSLSLRNKPIAWEKVGNAVVRGEGDSLIFLQSSEQ